MPAGSADSNRSPVVTVPTPRGPVKVLRQDSRGLRARSGWTTFWLARPAAREQWAQADNPREAIRRALLLPPKGAPWLAAAARDAQRQIAEIEADAGTSG